MTNTTAKPTLPLPAKNAPASALTARSSTTNTNVLKQALMPRSLDVDFSLKYRR